MRASCLAYVLDASAQWLVVNKLKVHIFKATPDMEADYLAISQDPQKVEHTGNADDECPVDCLRTEQQSSDCVRR